MDTSKTEFAPILKDSSNSEEKPLIPTDPVMPQKALYSIKPIPSELPALSRPEPNSDSAGSSALPSPTPSNEMATPSNEFIGERSILSSLANSTPSGDSMSPVLRAIDQGNQNESGDQSKGSRDARRGSKVKRVM